MEKKTTIDPTKVINIPGGNIRWITTNEIRMFKYSVTEAKPFEYGNETTREVKVTKLQQKWIMINWLGNNEDAIPEEWRDVPTVTE